MYVFSIANFMKIGLITSELKDLVLKGTVLNGLIAFKHICK